MKRSCPACGSLQNSLVFENRFVIPDQNAFYDGYNVVECDCGMIFADDLPSKTEFDQYYRAQLKKTSNFAANNYKEPLWYVNIHKNTSAWLNSHIGLAGKRILDVGCFSGDLMRHMLEYGADCYGYDPSTTGIMIANRYQLKACVADSFSSSSLYGYTFDLIVLSHVIEHILDPKSFFEDLDKALSTLSVIYIEVPDLENMHLSADKDMMIDQREPMLLFNSEHINFFTKQSLWRMMDRFGYEMIDADQSTDGLSVLAGVFRRKRPGRKYCENYLQECRQVYENVNKKLSSYLNDIVYIWGAGGHTQRSLINTDMKKLNIKAFIDNDQNLVGGYLFGKPIISPAKIDENHPIIISSLLYQDEIARQVSSMKLNNPVVKLYES